MSSQSKEEAAMNRQQVVEEQRSHPPAGDDIREQLLAGIPVTERRLQLAGVSTSELEGGNDPPVVLLHGQGHFAPEWIRVIPDLVATHRVVRQTCRATAPRRRLTARWTPIACSRGSVS